MSVSQYFVWFIFYSFIGWVWESIYCTIHEKKWADRGFLFGPICPIYGFCVTAVQILVQEFHLVSTSDTPIWEIFLIGLVGSAIVEYLTSYVLEKRFHARWWDYSNMPLNVNGRICVPASVLFGTAGIAVVKLLLPALQNVHSVVPAVVYEILSLLLAALVGADIALTEASLSTLLKQVEEYKAEMNQRAEATYETIAAMPQNFKSNVASTKELIAESTEKIKDSAIGKLEGSTEKFRESTREMFEESKERWAEAREQRAEAKEMREESREMQGESKEKIAARYVGNLDFFQRRTLSTIKKLTPQKGDISLPELGVTEAFKEALQNLKIKKKNK
ncbi:MAG: hypothetical protein Q4B03_04025 [Lachnospiraceae bacterium]|nr:hypothetical protein [Lachnospiraceae bacterium]